MSRWAQNHYFPAMTRHMQSKLQGDLQCDSALSCVCLSASTCCGHILVSKQVWGRWTGGLPWRQVWWWLLHVLGWCLERGHLLRLHTDASDFRTIFDTIPSDFHTIIFKCDWCWNKKEQLLMVRGDAQNSMYVLLDVPDLGERIIV